MKFSTKNILTFIFIFSVLLLISGCKSKKSVVSGGEILLNKSQEEVFNDVFRSEIEYRTISAKGSVDFRINGSGKKASAVFKMLKDSMMQVSIRFLGAEVARVTITTDSIFAINRLNKQYVAENLSLISERVDFNYYNLQSLMTNKIFIPGKRSLINSDFKNFEMTTTEENHILQAKGRHNVFYNFVIDGSDHLVSTQAFIKGDEKVAIDWSYNDFIKDSDNQFTYPTAMSAKINLDKIRVNLDISYSKLNIDEKGFEINNSISSSYNKKSLKEFMSSLPK